MSQTNCPRCKDPVRFPADLPGEAIVRCPLCAEEYAFSEMEANLPPMVEIVSLPESSKDTLDHLDRLLDAKPAGESVALVTTPRVSTGASTRSGVRRRPAESPWRPLILMIEIALSGVVGIALAVLVLWWLPGQWHRDPLSLKPVAGKYAPWLLPPAHRPLTELVADEDEFQAKSRKPAPKSASKPMSNKPVNDKKFDSAKPVSSEKPNSSKSPENEKNAANKPGVPSEPGAITEAAQKDLINSIPALEKDPEPSIINAKPQDLKNGLPPDHWLNSPEEPAEPPELVWTNSPEISALIRDAERRRTEPPSPKLDFAGRPEPDFAATFRELARVAGQINSEDIALDSARARLGDWLATLTDKDWKSAVQATAKDREKDSIAPRGVIYLAQLKQALAEGSWLHLELEPNPGDPTFPILIDPALFRASGGDAMIGKEVYVLGAELPDPKRLVSDVPSSVKKTWLIGAIRSAASSSPAKPSE